MEDQNQRRKRAQSPGAALTGGAAPGLALEVITATRMSRMSDGYGFRAGSRLPSVARSRRNSGFAGPEITE
jgi:hypothetical protein